MVPTVTVGFMLVIADSSLTLLVPSVALTVRRLPFSPFATCGAPCVCRRPAVPSASLAFLALPPWRPAALAASPAALAPPPTSLSLVTAVACASLFGEPQLREGLVGHTTNMALRDRWFSLCRK